MKLLLRSTVDDYEKLNEAIVLFGRIHRYGNGFLSTLELTIKEAFLNAVKHGNHENESLPITIFFNAGADGKLLEVTVRDSGLGFEPDDLPDPTTLGYLHKTSGRGVLLIRSYAEIVNVQTDSSGFSLTLRYTPF
ncbi:MAG: ATP-binding protein [Chlorobium limicola]|uniref:ATP-binding protein n=1 Tax=Chlorobium limicola TaxID=1092 RepID=UPI0023F1514E|nr:ATP-binding protein [Chlorobium limicola]NTV20839.1 ATP-binding protein [Chlorobium limicola]